MAGVLNHESFGNANLLTILEGIDDCVSSNESESEDSDGGRDLMQLSDSDQENGE
jgi:hypothetical protein